jgi:hypothetical protein
MSECTINDFIKAFKEEFGSIEFKATQHSNGLTVASRDWVEPPFPRLEITGDDYLKLASIKAGSPKPSDGVVKGLLSVILRKI